MHKSPAPCASTSPSPSPIPCSTLSVKSGFIQSPNFPDKYSGNDNCQWHIRVNESDFIRISVLDLSLGRPDLSYLDNLNVYDGPNANAGMITSITGNALPDDLYSTGSDIFLHFQAETSRTYYGFKIWFSAGNFTL